MTPRSIRLASLISASAFVLAACSASTDEPPVDASTASFAVVANADVGTGPTRLLIGILGADGSRLDAPDRPVSVEVAPADDPGQRQQADADFAWILEGVTGLYRATFDLDRPGTWSLVATPEGSDPLPPVPFTVREKTLTPNIGEPAPAAPTPTLRDHAIEDLTTDDEPDTRFYEMTLADAFDSGMPTVLVFSTPAYCLTATCGPILDTVKTQADAHPETNFIHIEVYTGFNEPGFAPDPSHLAPAVGPEFWNLPSEPWVFVIDEHGIVAARFEGAMSGEELAAALS